MTQEFSGRIALITGGASGIGRATALKFAEQGAHVVILDTNLAGGERAAAMVREKGTEALYIPGDVSKSDDVESAVQKTVDRFGHVDIACNSAGVAPESAANLRLTPEYNSVEWNRIMDVNLKGVWLCMKFQLLQMREQKSGVIVNVASVLGLNGFAGLSIYSASKHAVIGLTQAAAGYYSGTAIRINAVCPGLIRSPLVERLLPIEDTENTIGVGTPEQVADAILYLCSEQSTFVNGHALILDGGTHTF